MTNRSEQHRFAGLSDGESLGARIRAIPGYERIQIVLLTSMGRRGEAEQLAGQGFSAYLTKPIKSSQLAHCLQTVLGLAESDASGPFVTKHTIAENAKRGHILVVEDNATNQLVARRMLEKLGHTCDIAADGQEALRILARQHYDLVLMDCQMPVMDGYEATRQLRNGEGGVLDPNIPVIALTANAMQADRDKAVAAGMNDYLPKPFSSEQFSSTIERWLAGNLSQNEMIEAKPISIVANEIVFNPDTLLKNFSNDMDIVKELLPGGLAELKKISGELGTR